MRITIDRSLTGAWKRLAWFVGLWLAGVTSLAAVAAVIHLVLSTP